MATPIGLKKVTNEFKTQALRLSLRWSDGFCLACRQILARQQPCEVLQRNQMGVNAPHDALADQVLVLRGVEELELPLVDAVHTAKIHGAAFPERGLQRKGFEQRVVGEDRAHLAHPLEIGRAS